MERRAVPPRSPKIAQIGSITAEVAILLEGLREFYEARDRLIEGLVGKRYGQSRRREELIRTVVLNFRREVIGHVTDYEAQLRPFGSRATIRGELSILAEVGLIVMCEDAHDRRAIEVWPTTKLIDFYNSKLPELMCGAVAAVKQALAAKQNETC